MGWEIDIDSLKLTCSRFHRRCRIQGMVFRSKVDPNICKKSKGVPASSSSAEPVASSTSPSWSCPAPSSSCLPRYCSSLRISSSFSLSDLWHLPGWVRQKYPGMFPIHTFLSLMSICHAFFLMRSSLRSATLSSLLFLR